METLGRSILVKATDLYEILTQVLFKQGHLDDDVIEKVTGIIITYPGNTFRIDIETEEGSIQRKEQI